MSPSEKDKWICPQCGHTNYYHPSRCGHCPHGKRTSLDTRDADSLPEIGRHSGEHADIGETQQQRRILFLTLTGLAIVLWLFLIWEFRKWDAKWGAFNILIPTLLAAAIVGGWISRRNWFRDQTNPTRWRFIMIPLVGFLICGGLGIYFTEPIERGGSRTRSGNSVRTAVNSQSFDRRNPDYRYDYSSSRAGDVYLLSALFDVGSGVGTIADDAGDMDEFCIILLLVALVLLLVIGSVVVPHFWVLSTFVLLVIMAMVAYREWRLVKNPL